MTMAGLSGGFLAGDDLDVTLDEPCIRSKGSFLGAGGIMVFDDTRDMVKAAQDVIPQQPTGAGIFESRPREFFQFRDTRNGDR